MDNSNNSNNLNNLNTELENPDAVEKSQSVVNDVKVIDPNEQKFKEDVNKFLDDSFKEYTKDNITSHIFISKIPRLLHFIFKEQRYLLEKDNLIYILKEILIMIVKKYIHNNIERDLCIDFINIGLVPMLEELEKVDDYVKKCCMFICFPNKNSKKLKPKNSS